jgi:L-ascorbate metabolism protein UlaG (beta-lactamase superfamily)
MKNLAGFLLAAALLAITLQAGCVQSTDIPTVTSQGGDGKHTSDFSLSLTMANPGYDGIRVTFVCTEGVLVRVGNRKVLIDGLFHVGMPQGLPELIAEARPPFDAIDLLLFTHDHQDHFNAGLVRQYLLNSPGTRVLSTREVTDRLSDFEERVITLDAHEGEPAQTVMEGIKIKAYFLPHGEPSGGVINYGYLVTIGDTVFFHAGDFDDRDAGLSLLTAYQLDREEIDIAFVPYWLLPSFSTETHDGRIGSRYIIPVHYRFGDVQFIEDLYHPDAIFFDHYLQDWFMPGEE